MKTEFTRLNSEVAFRRDGLVLCVFNLPDSLSAAQLMNCLEEARLDAMKEGMRRAARMVTRGGIGLINAFDKEQQILKSANQLSEK